jgi:hypothetical protein
MDNPTRSRNRAAVVLALSVSLLLAARAMPDASVGRGLHLALMLVGMAGAPISAVWMLICWSDGKKYRRLKAGVGVIARWTVDPARWEWFRGQSKEWDKREGVRPNLLDLDQPCGPAGIEIVVTGDGLLVGRYFQPLEKNTAMRAYPGWMDLHYTIWKAKGPALHVNLRIPLASDGQHHADTIIQAYREAYAAAAAKRPSKIMILLVLFGGIAAITAVITLLSHLLKRGP